jgi:hypothetical protein
MDVIKYPPLPARASKEKCLRGITTPKEQSEQKSAEIDLGLLDYKSVDEFLYVARGDQRLSWHLAKQLKASRSLIALSEFLTCDAHPRVILAKIINSASAIIDAERVLLLEGNQKTGGLTLFSTHDTAHLDKSLTLDVGLECILFYIIFSI